jgi:glycerol kinase
MAQSYILAIDQGTTGSTCLVIDFSKPERPVLRGRETVDFTQHFPKAGWVEHDLNEIWSSVEKSCIAAMDKASKADAGFKKERIVGIGITNQRETLCVFDRQSSRPVANAIVWQCRRSTEICDRLKSAGMQETFKQKTGLVLDPYFSGTKITWLVENRPDVAQQVKSGHAVFGTIDTYLLHRLTGGKVHATEASNASRTLLYDMHAGKYDPQLCELLKVPALSSLPEVRDSAGDFGKTHGLGFLPDGIPVAGILGDQQAALAGQTSFEVGEAKCTYGTGAFLLLNTGASAPQSKNGLLTTVAWQLKGKRSFALEGSSFVAGAAVQFLRDQLGLVSKAGETEALAAEVKAAPEIIFVPALTGLGAPYWSPNSRGAIFGMTRGTSKNQLIRAALEGIAFQVHDLIEAARQDFAPGVGILRVDGGAAANDLLMQLQSDYNNVTVDRPKNLETTAFGAALFAGLGLGIYKSFEDMRNAREQDRMFTPNSNADHRASCTRQIESWKRAVKAVRLFAGDR